MPRRMIDKIS